MKQIQAQLRDDTTSGEARWDDIVFEKRNREYGAYTIRKVYSRNVILALVVTLVIIALAMSYPAIVSYFSEEEVAKEPAKTVKYTDLAPPPPIDKVKPPPKLDIPPPVKAAIKFLPPKVTEKEIVEEEIPTVKELEKNEVAPETTEGNGEIVFDEPVEVPKEEGEDPNKIYMIVEQPAEYMGGMAAMMKFIGQQMKYPPQARRMGIEGSVYVEFVVNAEGSISDVKVIKGIGGGCDEEAVRVVSKMPPWKPGKQNGKAVRSRFVLPVKFVLG